MIAVTVAACLLAAVSAAYAWRLARQERDRSDARVAALAAVLDPERSEEPPLFQDPAPAAGRMHPVAQIAFGFSAVVALIVTVVILNDVRTAPRAAVATTPRHPSLALLAMHNERDGSRLTVTGIVQNRSAAPAPDVTAVVLAFNRAGRVIARGNGPLGVERLAPGQQAPFRISVADAAEVDRYQVSFRDAGGIIRHIDLRQAPSRRSPAADTAPASRIASTQAEPVHR